MLIRCINRSLSRCLINGEIAKRDKSIDCTAADSSAPLPLIIPTSGVPIHLYTRDLESQALKQLTVLAESGIVKGFVAAMADVHVGEID